jgi:hypothetical protein
MVTPLKYILVMVFPLSSQAACFAGLGVAFMIMSLSFIIIDWTTGSSNSGGGH